MMKGGTGLPASLPATTGVNQANGVDAVVMSPGMIQVPSPVVQADPPTVNKPKGNSGNAPNCN